MTTQTTHAAALAAFLSISVDEVEQLSYDHYGLAHFSADGAEYAVGTDSEADTAAADHIRESLWAFNALFILDQCDLPPELEEAIETFCSQKCESANDTILALVEKCCDGGVESFAKAACQGDGRGHFLSGYDGEENEVDFDDGECTQTFYIYRTN